MVVWLATQLGQGECGSALDMSYFEDILCHLEKKSSEMEEIHKAMFEKSISLETQLHQHQVSLPVSAPDPLRSLVLDQDPPGGQFQPRRPRSRH